jgi:uncharacterized protein DUF5916
MHLTRAMSSRTLRVAAVALALCLGAAPAARAQSSLHGEPISIARATGQITIDGELSEDAWQHATKIERWYEVNPGDNTEPAVKNVGYLTYDDRFFYAAFEFEDPNPRAIRAPLGDHDNIGNGFDDYGGVLLDTRNSGRTGTFFVVTPHNTQYDSITDDTSGEDSSPDFFWDSATRITTRGWTLEIRIPFSSLRYKNTDPQTWGILLYRNYPRQFHYQFFSSRLPRGGNCFVCRGNPLVGLEGLPEGGHLVAAPYVSVADAANPRGGTLGEPLLADPVKAHVGLDVKFTPDADNAIDLTVKPDFSQIESDTAQISANERFALFFPEKRPFFLEGTDLFQTPIQAVYTRTITSPLWGARMTGKTSGVRYTALVVDDAGGGSAILPGPNGSSLAAQDFGSTVFVGRVKRDMGLSFVGLLVTDREAHDGNGHNRVVGPDFQWRPSTADIVSGQWVFSDTRTPNRRDLADEWTGQVVAGHAAVAQWNHNTTRLDWSGLYRDIGDRFRTDTGFVPQVGYREGYAQAGWTVRPKGFISRERTFLNFDYQAEPSGAVITRNLEPGFGLNTRWNGFAQFRYIDNRTRAGDRVIGRRQFGYFVQFSPSRLVTQAAIDGTAGGEIDFENARPGRGSTVNLSATLHPTDHLELAMVENNRWLAVADGTATSRRLFSARVSRLKATYTFTSRLFVRGIGQYVSTDRDPSLYLSEIPARSGQFSGSALFAYKLNWQSVMFVGYGDDRTLSDEHRLEQADRQFFVKISYAFQR